MAEGSRSRGWWHTLPGMLTAVAGLLTAVTGLIVAVNQLRGPGDSPREAQAEARPAPPAVQPASMRLLRAGSDAKLAGGRIVLTVVSARLEPFNAEQRLVRLNLRFTNDMRAFIRTYHMTLRLVTGGISIAPVDQPLEQVEAQSSKDVEYTFRIPAAANSAILRITRDEEVAEIPISIL